MSAFVTKNKNGKMLILNTDHIRTVVVHDENKALVFMVGQEKEIEIPANEVPNLLTAMSTK